MIFNSGSAKTIRLVAQHEPLQSVVVVGLGIRVIALFIEHEAKTIT